MKLRIGERIKQLRREKDITQEELSAILGVSFQSVSRWENNTCYPDLELLPTIANFFGVTVDSLMGVDDVMEQERVRQYRDEFQKAISVGDINSCIAISRKGVSEFPNNYELLNALMYALFASADEDGNIPDWKENMLKYDAEITALGERIMKYCPDQNIRLEAMARLAFNHCENGRKKIGRAIYEQLPPQDFCKESQMWWGLEEEERLPFVRDKIRKGYFALDSGIYLLSRNKLLPDEELVLVYEKELELAALMYDNNVPEDSWGEANAHCFYAGLLAKTGKTEKAFAELERAVRCAIAFDNRPEERVVGSVLLGEQTTHRYEFDTADSRPLCEIMRDKWLASADFDAVRGDDGFQRIIQALTREAKSN